MRRPGLENRTSLALAFAAAVALLVATPLARGASQPPASPLPPSFREISLGPGGGSVWQGRIPNGFVPAATRPTVIYLPPGFSAHRRYRVVYLLQGFRGSPYQFVSGLPLPAVADRLIDAHEVAPFVAVIPPAGVTARFDGEWTGVWEKYLVWDVVPWARRHLPLDARRRAQAVAGLSAGGYGAVDIGLRHPRLFGTLESWSGSFTAPHDGSLRHASAAGLAAHDPSLLAQREAPLLRTLGTRLFLSAGTRDRAAARAAAAFAGELSSLRIPHHLRLGPGRHNGRFWASQLAPALVYAADPRATRLAAAAPALPRASRPAAPPPSPRP
jgi:enterochelin esterase-like enzyme